MNDFTRGWLVGVLGMAIGEAVVFLTGYLIGRFWL